MMLQSLALLSALLFQSPLASASTTWKYQIDQQPTNGFDEIRFPLNLTNTTRGQGYFIRNTFHHVHENGHSSGILVSIAADQGRMGNLHVQYSTSIHGSTSLDPNCHEPKYWPPKPDCCNHHYLGIDQTILTETKLPNLADLTHQLGLQGNPVIRETNGTVCDYRIQVDVDCKIDLVITRYGKTNRWIATVHSNGQVIPVGVIDLPPVIGGITGTGRGYLANVTPMICDDLPFYKAGIFPSRVPQGFASSIIPPFDDRGCPGKTYDVAEDKGYIVYKGNHKCNGNGNCIEKQ